MIATLFYVMVSLLGLAVILSFTPAGRRFLGALRMALAAQTDKGAEAIANVDPLATYKSQIANAAEQGQKAIGLVAKTRSLLLSVDRQVATGKEEQKRLNYRIQNAVNSGDTAKAERNALELARVEGDLATNQTQLAELTSAYDEARTQVTSWQDEITRLRKDAESLGRQLDQSKSEREFQELRQNSRTQMDSSALAAARDRIVQQIDQNRGSAGAMSDLNQGANEEAEEAAAERSAKAQEILARFRSNQTASV